jgi:type IV pilus assembly protein PilA
MFQKLKNKMKDQRGLTLIELLAVIVILAIIAAIAIPSIMGLIDNSKKDAHVANAQQMINSAKIAVSADRTLMPKNNEEILVTLKYLEEKGYLETIKDPDGDDDSYQRETTTNASIPVTASAGSGSSAANSYVIIKNVGNKLSYSVHLFSTGGENRGVRVSPNGPVPENELTRSNVR